MRMTRTICAADDLKDWRKRHGVTQERLAEELGVRRPTVARWETGERVPNWTILDQALESVEARLKLNRRRRDMPTRSEEVEAKSLTVVDESGTTRIFLRVIDENAPAISLYDEEGNGRLLLTLTNGQQPRIQTFDENGEPTWEIRVGTE